VAAQHGKNCQILVNGVDLSSYFNTASIEAMVDTADSSTFRNGGWKTFEPGMAKATMAHGGVYDATLVTAVRALIGDTGDVLTVAPEGMDTAGNLAQLAKVLTSKLTNSAPVGGLVAAAWDVASDGEVGFGRVLHPLVAVSADANGTTVDDAAATTTGAIAHLHVTSVSTADTILVTVEDSANASTWATIGTFTLASAVTSQRLVIAGTVRRYVRAVWDVTGTGISITFAVALART
jgi:hypothetical protein